MIPEFHTLQKQLEDEIVSVNTSYQRMNEQHISQERKYRLQLAQHPAISRFIKSNAKVLFQRVRPN